MILASRKYVLRGLIAAPAVIAADRLMPLRGVGLPVPARTFSAFEFRNALHPSLLAGRIPRQWDRWFEEEILYFRAAGTWQQSSNVQ